MLETRSGQTEGREGMQYYPKIHEEKKKQFVTAVAVLCLLTPVRFHAPRIPGIPPGTPADPVCIIIAPVTTTTQMSSHMQGAWQSNVQAYKPSML